MPLSFLAFNFYKINCLINKKIHSIKTSGSVRFFSLLFVIMQPQPIEIYRALWREIHAAAEKAPESSNREALYNIKQILNKLPPYCECRSTGLDFLNALLYNNESNIDQVCDLGKFFRHFHNLVNIKLGKAIFCPENTAHRSL